jgi:hypothetical protein
MLDLPGTRDPQMNRHRRRRRGWRGRRRACGRGRRRGRVAVHEHDVMLCAEVDSIFHFPVEKIHRLVINTKWLLCPIFILFIGSQQIAIIINCQQFALPRYPPIRLPEPVQFVCICSLDAKIGRRIKIATRVLFERRHRHPADNHGRRPRRRRLRPHRKRQGERKGGADHEAKLRFS